MASSPRREHFVPRLYLKRWSTPQNKIWTYRTLVSHAQVGLWRERSTKGVAFQEHLYTQIVDGRESADIEEWLDKEFEAPAEEALDKATSDRRLTPDDWRILVKFLAAQDVRTPTRLSEALQRWESELPELLQESMKASVSEIETALKSGAPPRPQPAPPSGARFPLKVTTEITPGEDMGRLRAEIVAGRALWLFPMKDLLSRSAKNSPPASLDDSSAATRPNVVYQR